MKNKVKLNISQFLKKNKWTTRVLAEKTGISESYLTHIKNSTRRWNESALARISDAFNIQPARLIAGEPTDGLDVSINKQEDIPLFEQDNISFFSSFYLSNAESSMPTYIRSFPKINVLKDSEESFAVQISHNEYEEIEIDSGDIVLFSKKESYTEKDVVLLCDLDAKQDVITYYSDDLESLSKEKYTILGAVSCMFKCFGLQSE